MNLIFYAHSPGNEIQQSQFLMQHSWCLLFGKMDATNLTLWHLQSGKHRVPRGLRVSARCEQVSPQAR